jgi:unsaturated chondroitin disaccharide hydrolase
MQDSVWIRDRLEKIAIKYAQGLTETAAAGIIPYGGAEGRWFAAPYEGNTWWTNGFWPAMMWQLYAFSGDEAFMTEARRVQALLMHELSAHYEGLHHDVGFMYFLPFGAERQLFPSEENLNILLRCADILAGRFNPAGFIRAWNGADRAGWTIVDTMMNLPLLYWASEQSGDPRYRKMADAHAAYTQQAHIRPDGSCNHIIILDPDTGETLRKPRGQGCAEGSSWSRGQAWALYGFTLAGAHTGNAGYLYTAKRIAHYFIANIRPDGLTDCDFRQPEEPEKLDNIAGACAACGLLLLASLVSDNERRMYRNAAMRLLRGLDALCADYGAERFGILRKCTSAYHDDSAGTHINMVYGDYFYLEALLRADESGLRMWGL